MLLADTGDSNFATQSPQPICVSNRSSDLAWLNLCGLGDTHRHYYCISLLIQIHSSVSRSDLHVSAI